MSSFDKVVKLACKPKPAPPKAKYLDPIIAATWSEDGAVHDVCKALVPRLREPNAVVVFKALIVLHTMIRNGATDNVLSHLSSSEVLRLRNVSTGNWEGYHTPQNMEHYALYLDSRIRAYRELQHDAIHVQAESNRDMRLHTSIEEDMAYATAPPSKSSSSKPKTPQRSKTLMGRKLRVMTVEKGLLRETKTVQKMIDALVECRFYLDDLEDELTITALRMLVKDLLILFQAGNEGVINVLEHYFEMSKYDAEDALAIYRNFCGQTERVVEYLGVAKKLQNLLNVPIPNLKHAPVSLASSLQEYLNDPNFEQNRLEYKASKAAPGGNLNGRSAAPPASTGAPGSSTKAEILAKAPSPAPGSNKKPNATVPATDFFSSIEGEQTPVGNSASFMNDQFQQPAAHNPFIQRQMTGAFAPQPYSGQIQVQSTGFPASTPLQLAQGFQPPLPSQGNGFPIQPQQAPQHRPFSTFIPQQATGLQSGVATGFLQPQPTGANPFRQSVLVPQVTGMVTFNSSGTVAIPPLPTNSPFQITGNPPIQFSAQPTGQYAPIPNAQPAHRASISEVPARPASTPLTNVPPNPSSATPPIAQPVKSHQTGSRNPFGAPVVPAPPIPKPPTLLELSMGFGRLGADGSQPVSPLQPTAAQMQSHATESTFSSVASSFAFASRPQESAFSPSSDFSLYSNAPDPLFSSASSQPTNVAPTSPIRTHTTGFGGLKPFKPTSSFGASLLESLPPIPQSGATSPDPSAQTANHSSTPSLPTALNGTTSSAGRDSDGMRTLNPQPIGMPFLSQRPSGGLGPGVGMRPQATGALGGANPFRATMFTTTSAPAPGLTNNPLAPFASTPQFAGLSNGNGALPAFPTGFGGNAFAPAFAQFGQDGTPAVPQQTAGASLI